MLDPKFRRPSTDIDRIDINDPVMARIWAKAFGISKEQLEVAVLAAGTDAAKVRRHLSPDP
jgi:hypothetical protein